MINFLYIFTNIKECMRFFKKSINCREMKFYIFILFINFIYLFYLLILYIYIFIKYLSNEIEMIIMRSVVLR